MKRLFFILPLLLLFNTNLDAQDEHSAGFTWGNGYYFNMDAGESIRFKGVDVKLLQTENHYNQLQVGNDTVWLKVARRSMPESINGLRIFVADNKNVKSLTNDKDIHGLLKKDALICVSVSHLPLLDPLQFVFPVGFNDGFQWSAEEDSYPFSLYKKESTANSNIYGSFPGMGIDLHSARGRQKHWLVAVENSRVAWVQTNGNEACILLESESFPGIYYVYNRLYSRNVAVKKGQKLVRGDAVGTAWGDKSWGHAVITVIRRDTEPSPGDCYHNVVNSFPQWFDLYFQHNQNVTRYFARGRVQFGKPAWIDGNRKNLTAYETYTGRGWISGRWNPADKVEYVSKGSDANVRLKKILFEGTPAQARNPENFFEYRMNVRNGTYRIRAKVGDLYLPTWQKIEFEGLVAAEKSLPAGDFDWTPERVVKVEDGKLSIRIYVDPDNQKVAGISEIVFQRAF